MGDRSAVSCRRCRRDHPFGVYAVGDRVVLAARDPRPDGLQPGTKGVVVAYTIAAGARHQEVHVERKGGRIAVFAPCELAPIVAPPQQMCKLPEYTRMSREDFQRWLRDRRGQARLLFVADECVGGTVSSCPPLARPRSPQPRP